MMKDCIRLFALLLLVATVAQETLADDLPKGPATRGIVRMEVPQYPSIAQSALLEGRVRLRITISKEGRVISATVLSVDGNLDKSKLLGPEAVNSVMTWIYTQSAEETTQEVLFEYRLIPRRIFNPRTYVMLDSPQHIIVDSEEPEIEN